jgi:hypothetical protein
LKAGGWAKAGAAENRHNKASHKRIAGDDNSQVPLEKPCRRLQVLCMTQPIDVSVPHKLGREEARRRIAANIGSLQSQIPGGAAVTSNWVGDRLDLGISALGQKVDASITVEEAQARVHVELAGLLGMLAAPIAAAIKAKGPELLEDHRKG